MYRATCEWQPGVANVDRQEYVWSVDGADVATGTLQPAESTRSSDQDNVTINPQDIVSFSIVSANQFGKSDPAQATGTAPAPLPEAPSNVSMTFDEIAQPARR